MHPQTGIPSAAEAREFAVQPPGITERKKFGIEKKKRRKNVRMQLEGERDVPSEGEAMVEVPDLSLRIKTADST